MITYKEQPEHKRDRLPIIVKLDGKTIGKIVRASCGWSGRATAYQYRPKGVTNPDMFGDVLESVEAVKATLES